ncbi:MAG: hypothetical protein LBK53_09430 [Heliobacteriaceae bacterium]|jgi:hypothetical protein|nr:hypothetical protein [Heliobacteriaceae bacterium]
MDKTEKHIVSRLLLVEEYEKYIAQCNYPEDVELLITEYRKTFKPELLEEIECSFPIKIIKEIAVKMAFLEEDLLNPVLKLRLWFAKQDKRVLIAIALIIVFIFQVFLRYQYKVVANGLGTVKIDRLTGKTSVQSNIKKERK